MRKTMKAQIIKTGRSVQLSSKKKKKREKFTILSTANCISPIAPFKFQTWQLLMCWTALLNTFRDGVGDNNPDSCKRNGSSTKRARVKVGYWEQVIKMKANKKNNLWADTRDNLPKPRDATSVATRMGVLPLRKSEKIYKIHLV